MRKIGKNLAAPTLNDSRYGGIFNEHANLKKKDDICIFLSHVEEDKEHVIKIGDYILQSGFNIYLDIYDPELQSAASRGNHEAITKCLENGIKNSTHMLCIVSEETKNSWWVPYEIGYGKSSSNDLATLFLKDFDLEDIPSYLFVAPMLQGIKSLNAYLNEIQNKTEILLEKYSSYNPPNIISHTKNHPLDNTLKWNS
ncbi:hypothetical protein CON11_26410 [Priestia megaterium]|uniref:toll/interleukin-1 receptor domain-containing protein n=1 Tax=Priestia megaterium TaxID=1404 RepID=UPI000BECD4FC|nr:toll/interleukin-1 receptor domain-containing protein [Priestia megaterium]PEC41861.1 hypothetical protein CON11_26410 [Priestia megaterium]